MRDVTVLVYPGQNRQDPSPNPGGSSCPLTAWRCWGWLPHHPGLVHLQPSMVQGLHVRSMEV